MPTPHKSSLLRRTTYVAAAVAGALFAADASAATITLNGGTGTCTYSGMTIDPAGNVSVTCSGSTQPQTGPGTFTLSTTGGSAGENSVQSPAILRTGGSSGAVTVSYTTTGCVTQSGSVSFGDGDANPKPLSITVGAAGSSCVVTISSSTLGSISTPNVATFSVQSGTTTPPPPSSSSCPSGFTAPADMLTATLAGAGNILRQVQSSGQVVSVPLPAISWYTGQVALSESPTTYTPQPVTIEVSINKCPGLIEAPGGGNYCNIRSTNGNYNAITWFARPYSVVTSADSLISRGLPYCWAGDAGVQYYANMRWSYNSCGFGQQKCGFQIQYNQGPY